MAVVDGNEGLWSSAFWPMDFWPSKYWPNALVVTGFDDRVTHIEVAGGAVVSVRYLPEIIHRFENIT